MRLKVEWKIGATPKLKTQTELEFFQSYSRFRKIDQWFFKATVEIAKTNKKVKKRHEVNMLKKKLKVKKMTTSVISALHSGDRHDKKQCV